MLGRKNKHKNSRLSAQNFERQSSYNYRSSRNRSDNHLGRGKNDKSDRTLNWWLKRTPYIVSFLALFLAFLYSLYVDTNAKLEVVGDRAYLRQESEYQESINKSLTSSPLQRFRPTLNTAKIKQDIESQFPELQEVVVKLPLFRHRPVVEFRMAEPALIIDSGSGSYVVDKKGRALFGLQDKSDALNSSELPLLIDKTGTEVKIGAPLLSEYQTAYVYEIAAQAKTKSLSIQSIILQPGGQQLNVRFEPNKYYVKFNFQEDARQSIGAYFAVKDRLSKEGKVPSEYVDVRISERVYVK